jgi:GSH-dependent disulfide-bond oxidoreductase
LRHATHHKERDRIPQPIDLYYWPTPNGKKITIFLEEAGLSYDLVPVDITAGEQFDEEFLKISPNNKMPAIVGDEGPDGEPISVFESGAILLYLAEKTGRFLPQSVRGRYEALQWLMFQVSSVGPMLGQAHHFRQYAPERSLTPSTATPTKPPASTASWMNAFRKSSTSPAASTPS